jgi:hypothetical protein
VRRDMSGRLTYTAGVRALGGVLTVKAGRESNRKLAVSVFGSTLDIVAGSQKRKCGLKYVI